MIISASMVKVYSRKISPGMFANLLDVSMEKISSRLKISSLVTSSPDTFTIEGLCNCVSLRETSPLLFHSFIFVMIIKVSRLTRKKNIMESFILFPDHISFQTAYRLLGNRKNGINIKRATISEVTISQVTKHMKKYDMESGQVIR